MTAAQNIINILASQKNWFDSNGNGCGSFAPFGNLKFPYVEMGAISSFDLFGKDELTIFAFYWINRDRYHRALDCGANLGLHSILMARCGWDVIAFEPDPAHIDLLKSNLKNNDIDADAVDVHEAAISVNDGTTEFIRVCGNTTGNHLVGAKPNPYGKLERFNVNTVRAQPYFEWADFAKIDIEGHEAALITSLPPEMWLTTDAFVEIGTPENAYRIFAHLYGLPPISMFSPKIGWKSVNDWDELPHSCHEGSLFISSRSVMPWN